MSRSGETYVSVVTTSRPAAYPGSVVPGPRGTWASCHPDRVSSARTRAASESQSVSAEPPARADVNASSGPTSTSGSISSVVTGWDSSWWMALSREAGTATDLSWPVSSGKIALVGLVPFVGQYVAQVTDQLV